MSSIVFRKCISAKKCTNCQDDIKLGSQYYSGSYQSFCEKCYTDIYVTKKVVTKSNVDIAKSDIKTEGIVICSKCNDNSIGFIYGAQFCAIHANEELLKHT